MPSFNFRLLRYKLVFAIFGWLLVQSTTTASAPARGAITYALESDSKLTDYFQDFAR
jgi:hypothetical protein